MHVKCPKYNALYLAGIRPIALFTTKKSPTLDQSHNIAS